jgi:polar amino acid transport system substrate-binding protein
MNVGFGAAIWSTSSPSSVERLVSVTMMPARPLLVSVVLGVLAAACGSDGEAETRLDSVQESGVVRIGVRNDNPPMSFISDTGAWVGFDVDLAAAMAAELDVEAELVVVDGTTRISFIQDGRVDMSIASMNHTRSRDESIDFTITYFWDNQSFLVRAGTYAAIDDLIGETVAANVGSSVIASWEAYVAERDGPMPDIVQFDDKLAAMQALRDGAVEGYSEDNITLLSLAAGDEGLALLPGGHNPVQFGIGVPEDDSRWRDRLNTALQELWNDGTYMSVYERWFEGPERIIDLPLGGQMELWP